MIRFGGQDPNSPLRESPLPSSPLKRVVKLGSPLFGRRKTQHDSYGYMDSDDDNSGAFTCPKSILGEKEKGLLKANTDHHSPRSILQEAGLSKLEESIDKLLSENHLSEDTGSMYDSKSSLPQMDDPANDSSPRTPPRRKATASDLGSIDILHHITTPVSPNKVDTLDSPPSLGQREVRSPRIRRRSSGLNGSLHGSLHEGSRQRASSSILNSPRRRTTIRRRSMGAIDKGSGHLSRYSSHEILKDSDAAKSKERMATTTHDALSGKSKRRRELSRRSRRASSNTERSKCHLSTLHETDAPDASDPSPNVAPKLSGGVKPKRRNSLVISIYDKATQEKETEQNSGAILSDSEEGKMNNLIPLTGSSHFSTDFTPYEPDYSARSMSVESDHAAWISSASGHHRHIEILL